MPLFTTRGSTVILRFFPYIETQNSCYQHDQNLQPLPSAIQLPNLSKNCQKFTVGLKKCLFGEEYYY